MEEKGTNKVLVVIIFVLILGFAGYVGYNVMSQKPASNNGGTTNNGGTADTPKTEELNVKSDFVKDLYDKISFKSAGCNRLDENLTKSSLNVSEFTDGQKLLITIANVDSWNIESITTDKNMISDEHMKEAFYKVFGKNVEYSPLIPKAGEDVCPLYEYNSTEKAYIAKDGCGNQCGRYQREQLVKALKYSDKLEIYTVAAYCGIPNDDVTNMGCFYDSKMTNKISDDTEMDFTTYKDKLANYKYTLTYDNETGNYYYYSIEKLS